MRIRRLRSAAVILSAAILLFVGLAATQPVMSAQNQSQTAKIAILFPSDDDFGDYEDLTETTTDLSGSEWIGEFNKQTKFGDVTSDNGLKGILYVDALRMGQLFDGQSKFLFYGLFTFPGDHPVSSSKKTVEYGIVVYLTRDEMVIVLIDLQKDGKIAAFVVVPREGNRTPAIPILNLDAFLSVFFILEALPSINSSSTSQPSAPPATSGANLACPAGLAKVRDLNMTLDSAQSITTVKDASGADLYEISVAPPNKIVVRSYSKTQRVDAVYTAEGATQLIFLAGPSKQEIELTDGKKFVLTVTAGDKQSCVLATPSKSGNNLKITGELRAK